jgi:hypothetical protein
MATSRAHVIPVPAASVSRLPARRDVVRLRGPTAILAGVAGALLMSLLMALGVWMQRSPFALEELLGGLFAARDRRSEVYVVGLLWHLINGGLFALIYATIFCRRGRAGVRAGLALAVLHWIVAAVLVNVLLGLHPWTQGPLRRSAGPAVPFGGMTIWGSLVLHLAYGATVGALLGRAARTSAQSEAPPRETDVPVRPAA